MNVLASILRDVYFPDGLPDDQDTAREMVRAALAHLFSQTADAD